MIWKGHYGQSKKKIHILCMFFISIHLLAQADRVTLIDNTRYRGKILISSASTLKIRTRQGIISIDRVKIKKIQYDDSFDPANNQARYLYYERMAQIDRPRERFDLAIFCLEQGLYQEALQEFNKLIPQLPSELDTLKSYISQTEKLDFLSLIQKSRWWLQTAQNNEQAYLSLEKAKNRYPDKIYQHQKLMLDIQQGIKNQQAIVNAKRNLTQVQSENFNIFLPSELEPAFWLNFSEMIRKKLFLYMDENNPLSWNPPCELILLANKQAYINASEDIEWSDARSLVILDRKEGQTIGIKKRIILSYLQSPEILQPILVHEIAHLVIHDLMGLTAKVPLWLSEGLSNHFMGKDYPLKESSFSHVIQFKDEYPSFKEDFYQNASHLVKTLIKLKDLKTFLNFTFLVSTGYTFEEAFLLSYPEHKHKLKEWGLSSDNRRQKPENRK